MILEPNHSVVLMAADTNTGKREERPTGKLKYEVVEGRTAATHVYATYPLKFLHPRRTIHQDFDTYITVRQLCCDYVRG